MKKEFKKYAEENLADYPDLISDDLINETFTTNAVEKEIEDLINQLYNSDTVEIDVKIVVDMYLDNLNNYFVNHNISIPEDIRSSINKVIEKTSLEKIDITTDIKELKDGLDLYKDVVGKVITGLIIAIIIILVAAVIISKEKFNVVYKPFIFAGVMLFLLRTSFMVLMKVFIMAIKGDADTFAKEWLVKIIEEIRNVFLADMTKAVIICLVLGIGLAITKYVLKNKNFFKKDDDNDSNDDNNSDEAIKEL